MKIGTMVTLSDLKTTEERLIKLKNHGFNSCQIVSWKPQLWTRENAEGLKELIEKYEIEVSAFWCGWEGPCMWNFYEAQIMLGLLPPEYRQMRVKNLCDGADFAKLIGVTDVVTHMGFIPENPYDPNFAPMCVAIRTVANHLKKNGQYLLFETGQETPVTLIRCFETVGTDNLGINLDTANLIMYGKANPVDALDVFGKYVRNLHAKDGVYPTNGHDLGHQKKIGEGKVDFPALFKKLHELGFDSHVTIEREISGEQQMIDVIEAKEYLEKIISEIYGG